MTTKYVVFLCPHNALRSVIATELFNQAVGERAIGQSAGTEPAERVNERTIQVLKEVGIDVADVKPARVTREQLEKADRVIRLDCPLNAEFEAVIVGKSENWSMPDTAGKPVEAVRDVRELVHARVMQLVSEMDL